MPLKIDEIGEVFRVEDPSGIGPYCSEIWKETADYFAYLHDGCNNHPVPIDDPEIKMYMKADQRCAFESMEQLDNWFTKKQQKRLLRDGFRIVKRKGVIIGRSKFQVVFQPTESTGEILEGGDF